MLQVRKVQRTDDLSNLTDEIFQLLTEIYDDSPWQYRLIRYRLKDEHSEVYIAQRNQEIVGFMVVKNIAGDYELDNIGVKPDFQGQKVGSQLMDCLSNLTGTIFLEVRSSNLTAQQLYKKYGFTEYNIRKNYYQNPLEDAVLMKREK